MRARRKAHHANCWGPLGGNAVGVTSIAELTYRTFGDMARAIAEIGEASYEGVELFDGNLLDYEANRGSLRTSLSNAGVKLIAVYSGANFIFSAILEEELAKIRRAADAAAAVGAEHLVVGGGAKRASGLGPGDHDRLAEALDRVVEIAAERGLRAHYHPHLSTVVEGPEEVRKVFAKTSIDFCPDTAHLAAAGGEPAAMIREHRNRISYVHLKGLRKTPFAFTPLDEGDLDVTEILLALDETKFEGWIAVELNSWPDPKDGAVRSLAFLRRAEAAA